MAPNGAIFFFCSPCKILYFASSVHPKIATVYDSPETVQEEIGIPRWRISARVARHEIKLDAKTCLVGGIYLTQKKVCKLQ